MWKQLPLVFVQLNYRVKYLQVKPIDKKRLLAFVNHYVTHTVRFLNKFAGVCEEKMSRIELQIQRLEISLNILEGKVSMSALITFVISAVVIYHVCYSSTLFLA